MTVPQNTRLSTPPEIVIHQPNPYKALPNKPVAMSFPQFDPSQGQQAQFAEGNGNGATSQQTAPAMPSQAIPQQMGQDSGSPAPFQGQAGEGGSTGSVQGGDAKTTLW